MFDSVVYLAPAVLLMVLHVRQLLANDASTTRRTVATRVATRRAAWHTQQREHGCFGQLISAQTRLGGGQRAYAALMRAVCCIAAALFILTSIALSLLFNRHLLIFNGGNNQTPDLTGVTVTHTKLPLHLDRHPPNPLSH